VSVCGGVMCADLGSSNNNVFVFGMRVSHLCVSESTVYTETLFE